MQDNHKIYYQINAVASGKKEKSDKSDAKSAASTTVSTKPIEESASTASLSSIAQSVDTQVKVPKGDDEKIKEAIRDVQISWVLK